MTRTTSKFTKQNVQGWERVASLTGGLYLLGKGLRRGGLGGLLQIGMGAMTLARGVTGHCEAKRVLSEVNEQAKQAEGTSRNLPLERHEAENRQLKASAQAATETATVTGNDSLRNPPTGV